MEQERGQKNIISVLKKSSGKIAFWCLNSNIQFNSQADDTLGNFLSNVAMHGDKEPMTNLKYPNVNLLPVLNGESAQATLLKKVAQQNWSKSCPMYHQPQIPVSNI